MTMPTPLTAEHISFLIELRDDLVDHGADHFNMDTWLTVVSIDDNEEEFAEEYSLAEVLTRTPRFSGWINQCGTTACFAGHIALTSYRLDGHAVLPGMSFNDVNVRDAQREVAKLAGLDVDLEPSDRMSYLMEIPWFATNQWPAWAKELLSQAWDRHVIRTGDVREWGWTFDCAPSSVVLNVILSVIDDLIHGRRLNWYDNDTIAVDQADRIDAQ